MKKLLLTFLCLSNLSTEVQASSTFTSFASGAKSLFFTVGRGLHHFYFPNYGSHTSDTSSNSEIYREWAKKDMLDTDQYWNQESLTRWVQTSHEQGEPPLGNPRKKIRNAKRHYPSLTEEEHLLSDAHHFSKK